MKSGGSKKIQLRNGSGKECHNVREKKKERQRVRAREREREKLNESEAFFKQFGGRGTSNPGKQICGSLKYLFYNFAGFYHRRREHILLSRGLELISQGVLGIKIFSFF